MQRGARENDDEAVAPRSALPQTSFVSVEYPAVLTEQPYPGQHYDDHPSLSKALQSLSPLPSAYASAQSALTYLGQTVGQGGSREVECKLSLALHKERDAFDHPARPVTTNEIFRHAIQGEVVDAHNIVCRVRKRTWKRTRADGTTEEHKEYAIDALGITRHVVRFRTMPDYVYDSGNLVDPKQRGTDGKTPDQAPSMRLHDSLRQMDIEGIRSFKLPEEDREAYEENVPGRGLVSNVRMPPPAIFDITGTPYPYGFRQNSTSTLRPYGEPDANGILPLRYVNNMSSRMYTPIRFSILSSSARKSAVPQEPMAAVKAYEKVHPKMVQKLRDLFDEHPMWSRRALTNQFKGEEKRALRNRKAFFSLVSYAITDGCWRDNLVQFGYDPRKDKNARFYQRLAFQRQQEPRTNLQKQRRGDQDGDGEYDDEEEAGGAENALQAARPDEDDQSHIFDGNDPKLTSGNYLLIDVRDEYVRRLIYAEGEGVIGNELHKVSGWYTPQHYAKIRALLEHRMNALRQTGKPASHESSTAIIEGL